MTEMFDQIIPKPEDEIQIDKLLRVRLDGIIRDLRAQPTVGGHR